MHEYIYTLDHAQPWDRKQQRKIISSGFIINGNRILCTAHGIADFCTINIKKVKKYNKNTIK